jgi:hypothetical protein
MTARVLHPWETTEPRERGFSCTAEPGQVVLIEHADGSRERAVVHSSTTLPNTANRLVRVQLLRPWRGMWVTLKTLHTIPAGAYVSRVTTPAFDWSAVRIVRR